MVAVNHIKFINGKICGSRFNKMAAYCFDKEKFTTLSH